MASPRNTIGGLDINRTEICYTRCLPESRLIANVCIQPLEIGADDYWGTVHSAFDDFLKEFKIPGENIVSSLPGEYAIIKKISLESDEEDIDDAVEWELSQQIIGSIDEYVYDYQLLNDNGGGDFQNYLVVGYRGTAVDKITKLLKSKKLNPIIIDLDIFALVNVYEINYEDRITIPALIIFSDTLRTKLIATVNGNFYDVEMFDHTEEVQAVESYIEVLNENINKLLAYNKKFAELGGMQLYLAGSYFSKPETVEAVLGRVKNSEVLFPFRKITCSAGMDDEKLREFSPQLAVSVGLALRDFD